MPPQGGSRLLRLGERGAIVVLVAVLIAFPALASPTHAPPPSLGAPHSTFPPSSEDGYNILEGAARSLQHGGGPTGGLAYHCTLGSTASAHCVVASAGPSPNSRFALPTSNQSTGWANVSAPVSPSPRGFAALAFDPSISAVLLFGGTNLSGGAENDTWTFSSGRWTNLSANLSTAPSPRWSAGMAYDARDGYVLLFGGRQGSTFFNDTWEFNGSAWRLLSPSPAPSPRAAALLSYDASDRYVVLFGGYNGSFPTPDNETWSFVSGNWTNLTNASRPAPAPLVGGGMAFDGSDGAVLYFGGALPVSPGCLPGFPSTWTFSAGNWTNRTPLLAVSPPPRGGGIAMGYDPVAQAVVMVGGFDEVGGLCEALNDTWAYQDGNWTSLTPFYPNGPSPRGADALVGDPSVQGSLLFGGNGGATNPTPGGLNDTWTLGIGAGLHANWSIGPTTVLPGEGVTWSVQPFLGIRPYSVSWDFGDGSPNATGSLVGSHAYANSGRYTVNGTVQDSNGSTRTFARPILVTNATWTDLSNWSNAPSGGADVAMTYDPFLGGVLLYGGAPSPTYTLSDTWLFTDGNWTAILPSSGAIPPAVKGASLVYDSADGVALLFGGESVSGGTTTALNETYEFNSTLDQWVQLSEATAPSPRAFSAMFDDPSDGYVVLFGGTCPGCGLNGTDRVFQDTWTFRGGLWTNQTATFYGVPPPLRFDSGAYDASAGVGVLVGGTSAGCPATSITWTFSAGAWSNATASAGTSPPAPGGSGGMAYDPSLGGVVRFGGESAGGAGCAPTNTTWLFRQGTWSNLTPQANLTASFAAPPTARYGAALVYDYANALLVLYGGDASASPSGRVLFDTWSFPGLPMVASMSAVPAVGDAPLTVNLSVVPHGGTAPFRAVWTFGDGSPSATNLSVSHRYRTGGTFFAVVTVTDHRGRILENQVNVTLSPHLSVTAGTTTRVVERPYGIGFRSHVVGGQSPFTYYWGFGDGQSSTSANPNHYYALAGNYTASLTVRDAYNQVNVSLVTVRVFNALVASDTVAPLWGDAPLLVRANGSAQGGVGPYTLHWNFGDKSPLVGGSSALHTYLVSGAFTVTFNVTDSLNYTVLETASVAVEPPLTGSISASPPSGLAPLPVAFVAYLSGGTLPYNETWSFGEGSLVYGTPSATHTYSKPGNFTVRFTLVDATGATVNATTTVAVVKPLSAHPTASANEGANPFTVQFSAGIVGGLGPLNYTWSFSDGSPDAYVADPSHTFTELGSHRVTLQVVDALGEVAGGQVEIQVVRPLLVTLSSSASSGDVGWNFTLTAVTSGGVLPLHYAWTGLPTGCAPSDAALLSCVADGPGIFAVQVNVTDAINESVLANTTLTVRPNPSTTSPSLLSGFPGGLLGLGAVVALALVALLAVLGMRRRREDAPEADAPSTGPVMEEEAGESTDPPPETPP